MPKRKRELTEEEKQARKDRKNQQARERYNLLRKAGLNPEEARSVKKTLDQSPEIVQQATTTAIEFMKGMRGVGRVLDQALDAIEATVAPPKKTSTRKAKSADVKKGRTSGQTSGGKASPQKGIGQKSRSRKTPKPRKDYSSFQDFIRAHPDLGVNELKRAAREAGLSIGGNVKANETIRQTRQENKRFDKVHRIVYRAPEEVSRHYYVPERYIYLVRFEIETEDAADTFTEYLTIKSNTRLTMVDIVNETLDTWADLHEQGIERYKPLGIIEDSIVLVWAVDKTLGKGA